MTQALKTPPDQPLHSHATVTPPPAAGLQSPFQTSALGWPAWLRVLLVLPLVALLWLAVAWANTGTGAW